MQINNILNNRIKSLAIGFAGVIFAFALQLAIAPRAHATTYTVNAASTPGGCGLVQAIAEVAAPGTTDCALSDGTDIINIEAGTYDLSSLPAVAIDIPGTSLTINGAAAKTTILDGGGTAAGLIVNSTGGTGDIIVNNLTIQNFQATGDIVSIITMLTGAGTFNNLIITDNLCTPGTGGVSCSVLVSPQATLSNSAIFNNISGALITAGNGGGPSSTILNVYNNTFYNNTGTIMNLINYGEGTNSTVNFVNNTVVKNISQLGAALAVDVSPGSGVGNSILNLKNNIFLNNTIETSEGAITTCLIGSETGVINSQGGNIADDASCTSFGANDSSNTSTEIASSLASAGDTYVLPITNTSKAYEYGQSGGSGGLATPSTDQRGVSRPQGSAPDSGAYELEVTTPGLPNTGNTTKSNTQNMNLIMLVAGLATLTGLVGFAVAKRK